MEYVAATMAAVSAISSIVGGISGNKAAKKAANMQAKMEGEVTIAKLEDLLAEERQLKGQTLAAAAGSGVKVNKGSPLEILAEQARTFERERAVVSKVGANNASVLGQQGRMIGKQAAYQGFSQGMAQGANAFSMFSKIV